MRNERGIALPMVLIVFLVGFALVTAFLVAIVGSAQVSNTTRSGIQAQAAAEAGIAAAVSSIGDGNPCDFSGVSSSATPEYMVTADKAKCNSPSDASISLRAEGRAPDGSHATVEAVFEVEAAGSDDTAVDFGAIKWPATGGFSLSDLKIKAENPEASPSLFVESGDFSCTSGGTIEGSVYVLNGKVSGNGGCRVDGSLYATGDISIARGTHVGGDLVSTNGNVTVIEGNSIGGSVYANNVVGTQLSPNTFGSDVYARGSVTFGGGSPAVVGTVIYGGTFQHSSATAAGSVGGAVPSRGSFVMPTMPPAPEWIKVGRTEINALNGFDRITWSGDCVFGWWPLPTMPATIEGLKAPTIIDATHCAKVDITNYSSDMKLNTDVVIIGNAFTIRQQKFVSGNSSPHNLWFIALDPQDCSVGEKGKVQIGGATFDNLITALAYTPCDINFMNAGENWRGSVYSKTASGKPNLTYVPIGLPSVEPSGGSGGGSGTPTLIGGASAVPIVQRNIVG